MAASRSSGSRAAGTPATPPAPGPRAALRRPGALAALLAAGAIAGAPAPAAAGPNGEHAGGGRDDGSAVTGQAQPAPAPPAAAPAAPAEARQDRETKAEAPIVPVPQVAASGITDRAPSGAPAASSGSGRTGRGRPQSSGRTPPRRPSAAPAPGGGSDAGTTSPASAPGSAAGSGDPVIATAAAASPTAAAPAGPSPSPARAGERPTARSRAAGRRARARARARAARRLAAARTPVADRRRGEVRPGAAPLAPAGTVLGTAVAVRAPARAPAASPATAPARGVEVGDGSTITRTVVQVLEVIPLRLRIALGALAAIGVVLGAAALVQARRLRRLERLRGRLAADVGVLQSALLPELPARIGGAKVTAAYRPAEGLAAGGDFYDGFELPDGRTAILIGDVAGHGRDVVPVTALVRYSLRAYLEAGLEPRAALAVASDLLGPQLDGRVVTVAVAIFDHVAGRLTFACAGHWPPTLLGAASVPVKACSSPPLGAGVPTGRRQTTLALPPGSSACLHTDGLADVMVGSERLGMDGLAAQVEAVGARGEAADVLERIVGLSDQQPDDMAVCVLTVLPGGGSGAGPRLEVLEADRAMLRGTRVERFLAACGAEEPAIAAALAEARYVADRDGTAVLEVTLWGADVGVAVLAAAPPPLPIPRPDAAPALAAAG